MNLVALIGNAAADPELRHTTSGKAVCELRLAVSRPGGDTADFFTIISWDRQAEVVAEYVQKGRKIAVEGRLQHSTWDTDAGKRSKVEVVAHRIDLLGGPRDPDTEAAPQDAQDASAAAAGFTY